MLANQLAAAIGAARTPAVLDALAKATWSGLAIGQITEDQAQDAAAAIEGRRGEFRRPIVPTSNLPYVAAGPDRERRRGTIFRTQGQTLFARARGQRPPDRAASLARRRHLAASGPMPPALAAQFTTGELAVLRIVADEVRDKGRCDRTYAELAARAGVCRRSARNAVRTAGRLGLVHIEERPRPRRKHLANVLQIV